MLRRRGRIFVSALRRRTAPLRRLFAGVIPPADMQERLYLDQAVDFTRVITARAFVGLSTTAFMFFDFRAQPVAFWLDTICMGIAGSYLFIIFLCRNWFRLRIATGAQAKRHIRRVSYVLVLVGSLWACLFNLLIPYGTVGQHELLYGVAIALISTPVLVSPLSAAFAFWTPICLGTIAALVNHHTVDPFALCDLIGFMTLTGYCIIYLNRRMNERAIGAIKLAENAEVIKLLLRDFEESASDWLWETDAQMRMRHVSKRLVQVARRPAAQITGLFPRALLGEIMNYEHRAGSPIERLIRAIEERSPFRDLVVPVIIDGEERYWSLTGKPILDKFGRFAGYHGVGSDITGQRRQQEHIAFLARHDSLTKLPNRVLFSEFLHQACQNIEHTGATLLSLDLDHFKIVNDTLGHATGDAVLVAVAERLRSCIREIDLAARLGGDEFAIILLTADVPEITAIAERIIDRITRPYYFDGQLLQIGVSIGITRAPQDAQATSGLMKNADLALYRAKTDGRGRFRFYDSEMDERVQDRRALQSALRQALARNEFRLEYQPIVDLASRKFCGAEALLRWQHPERGLLQPADFITIAEETGLISHIGDWVLHQACAEAAHWPADISIAVNLSPLQFREPGLVDTIDRALSESGLAPSRLELEITETTMLETSPQTVDALWQLHARGVRIALDDFGTGYSSLSYLRRFPFDKIKIDRSFIRDLGYEKDDSSIILAIIGLAQRMNMQVTAEGVETAEQAELLTIYGCGQAQGYLFSYPIPAARLATLIGAPNPTPLARPFGTQEAAQ